jgi:TfoX/Sxy family transcriptional regulator of competence genes
LLIEDRTRRFRIFNQQSAINNQQYRSPPQSAELRLYSPCQAVSMLVEALQARLRVLEDEILRLTKLASQAPDTREQDSYWRLAQDLQREARELRSEIRRASEPEAREAHTSPASGECCVD